MLSVAVKVIDRRQVGQTFTAAAEEAKPTVVDKYAARFSATAPSVERAVT